MLKHDRQNFQKGILVGLIIALFIICPLAIIVLGDIQNIVANSLMESHQRSDLVNGIDKPKYIFGMFLAVGIVSLVCVVIIGLQDRKRRKCVSQAGNA
jgi:uncharacterized membrane protein